MIRTLSKSIRQYRLPSVLSPVFVTGEVLLECFIPLVMADLIDEMTGTSMTPILHYGLILIILAMLSLLCGVLSGYYAASAACGFAKNLRMDEYFKIQALSFSDIDRFSTSSLVTRLTTDITNVQNAYQMLIRVAIRGPLMLVISIIMSVSINPRMSLIFLAIIPVLASALFLISSKVMPIFRQIFKKYDAMNASIQENVAGIRVVKAFVREEYEKKKFSATSGDVCADFTMAEKILALNNPVMTFCIYLALLLVSAIGARIIITSGGAALTTGDLSSLINYGTQILTSLMMLSMVFVMVSMAVESGRRIEEVLTTESSIKSPENGILEVKDGSVEFRSVSFRYQEKAKRNVLGDISLKIASGETIGIIGGTGSSKSSLVQLIPRLYDVNEGEVLVGGVNVRDYNLEALRNAVAVVLQKNTLFSGTIRENLLWGNENASEEEILEASRLAQADEFVQQFPHKYDTYVSQGGTSVSGGQKQRLCIARALLKKPKILILDDSTSAVDTRTDALIRMAFREKIPFTTKIIIAQRVSSVEDADRILVMEDGKIAEMGTHEELLALGGIYRSIYDSQSRTEKEEAS